MGAVIHKLTVISADTHLHGQTDSVEEDECEHQILKVGGINHIPHLVLVGVLRDITTQRTGLQGILHTLTLWKTHTQTHKCWLLPLEHVCWCSSPTPCQSVSLYSDHHEAKSSRIVFWQSKKALSSQTIPPSPLCIPVLLLIHAPSENPAAESWPRSFFQL